MLKKILYTLWISVFAVLLFISAKNGSFVSFINSTENRTFDIRQSIITNSGIRKHSKDIVIVAIDDGSYEYILDKYGEWPLRRDIYSKMVNYIESQNPKSIAFDLMFVKSLKSDKGSDEALVNSFKQYKNVYTAMNFDNQPEDLREASILPDKLAVNLKNNSNKNNYDYLEYSNCRTILAGIMDATSNIGMINVSRSDDGVLRNMPLFIKYNGKYYPQLALLVGKNYLGYKNNNSYTVSKRGVVNLDKTKAKFYPDKDGGVILNWYGPAGTFENIPMYKLLKAINGDKSENFDFHNKVVYIGATAASLFDIKTVPVDKVYPGVEVQTTYVNNVIDNSFIKKCPEYVNIILSLILALLTIIFVAGIESMPVAFGISITTYAFYIMFTYKMMDGTFGSYWWIKIVAPLTFALFSFIFAVIIKYLIKSKDFDQQYKLATTDGLTELYNHRYFQEQMKLFTSRSDRYDVPLSLIIIDIDNFKTFNDSFGHQSGDAVLRQVAFLLKKNVRLSDIVCRYGGEELSIILPNTNNEEAVSIANKLCKLVSSQNFKLSNGRESNVTISLGVSTFGEEDGLIPSDLIESADKRLYNAKNSGRNRVN